MADDVNQPNFKVALAAGAIAGLAVDMLLFPLDTIKTRLQSSVGFRNAGGFRNIYSGLGSVAVGSSPGAAVFFCTYESVKSFISPHVPLNKMTFVHMAAASFGEMASCIVRVPTEVIKQRTQTSRYSSSWQVLKHTLHSEGFYGLYRGYITTVLREVPFSFIQFPIWEYFKHTWTQRQGYYVKSWQSSLCGGVAGGIAASLTTPIDVAKTRIMLAQKGNIDARGNMIQVMKNIFKDKGLSGLFAGLVPRALWMTIGGIVFFGIYEKAKNVMNVIRSQEDS